MARNKSNTPLLTVQKPDAAGIDIGARSIYVALPPERAEQTVRRFGTFTEDLNELADWLMVHGIKTVAMESTGVFWIPIFQILEERGLEVFLVNARHVKGVPGRKTDVQDCQWLQFLHSVGLLKASFRPADEIVVIRSLTRHRANLVRDAARAIQHMQKSMQQMNIQLHHVISDISGQTGLAIIDAIIGGERDRKALAQLRHYRIKASEETIIKALEGDYREEHLFVLTQARQQFAFTQTQLAAVDKKIAEMLHLYNTDEELNDTPVSAQTSYSSEQKSFFRTEMKEAFGIDLFAIPTIGIDTAIQILTEVGPDFSKFKSGAAFAAWLALCPRKESTGDKLKSSKTLRTKSRLAHSLRNACQSLAAEKGYYGDMYRRLRGRLGAPKALTAMAHRIARLIYTLVTKGEEFSESVFAAATARQKAKREKRLHSQARALGFKLVTAD